MSLTGSFKVTPMERDATTLLGSLVGPLQTWMSLAGSFKVTPMESSGARHLGNLETLQTYTSHLLETSRSDAGTCISNSLETRPSDYFGACVLAIP